MAAESPRRPRKEGRHCCFLISIPLEPGNLDSSSDFARDSSLDLVLFYILKLSCLPLEVFGDKMWWDSSSSRVLNRPC